MHREVYNDFPWMSMRPALQHNVQRMPRTTNSNELREVRAAEGGRGAAKFVLISHVERILIMLMLGKPRYYDMDVFICASTADRYIACSHNTGLA